MKQRRGRRTRRVCIPANSPNQTNLQCGFCWRAARWCKRKIIERHKARIWATRSRKSCNRKPSSWNQRSFEIDFSVNKDRLGQGKHEEVVGDSIPYPVPHFFLSRHCQYFNQIRPDSGGSRRETACWGRDGGKTGRLTCNVNFSMYSVMCRQRHCIGAL